MLIVLGVALISLLVFRGVQEFSARIPMPPPDETGGVISVTSAELFNAYEKDETTADAKYRGRTLEVTGEVILKSNFFLFLFVGKCYIVLGSGDPYQVFGVRGIFSDEIDQRVYDVKKHDNVTIRGVCEGLKTDVILGQCNLVK